MVARRPDDPQLRLQRAQVMQAAGEWDAALAEAEVAAARGMNRDEVDTVRALILLDAGRSEAALVEIDRLLVRRPDAYDLVFARGRALRALGRSEEAAQELGRAINRMPRPTPEQVMVRRDVLLALGRRGDAVTALDEGMARLGRVASLQLAAIGLEVDLGRYDAALRRVDELLGRSPSNPAWISRRGQILAAAGRTAEARAEYARALAIIDRRPATRRSKGFDALKRRLETDLASLSDGGKRQ